MSDNDTIYRFLDELENLRKRYGNLTMIEVVGCLEMEKQSLMTEMWDAAAYIEEELASVQEENGH